MGSCVNKEITLTNIDRMKTPYLDTEIELLEGFKDKKEASFYQSRKLAEYREIKQLLIHSFVVPKGTLSNLDEAIKKAKPNMDKIKDVDKHIDSIR